MQVDPDYSKLPRPIREEMKKASKDFLVTRLGEYGFKRDCILAYVQGNLILSTYIIPFELEEDYKKWAREHLATLKK